MHVVIFEGVHWRTFAPLALSRPVFQLSCGTSTLLEKQIRATKPTRITFWIRNELADYCRRIVIPTLPCPAEINVPLDDEPALILSGRTLFLSQFEYSDSPCAVIDEGITGRRLVRHAIVKSPGLSREDIVNRTDRWRQDVLDLPGTLPQGRLPQFVWDLINWNEEAIMADFIAMSQPTTPPPAGPFHIIEPNNLWLGKNVKLAPGCVLDGARGPVILDEGVSVGANTVLQGPCYIGPATQIAPLTAIRSGTSIGQMCKIGGEISNSIIMSYTNKGHHGFLGDSYLGEWVNFGAGTTTSNLKNTYGEVTMTVDGHTVKSGRRFLGSLIGDHTKTAINTSLMTGSYVGYCCMVGSSKHPPRFIRSYTFLTDDGAEPYRMEQAEQTMKAVFTRRNRVWDETDKAMNEYVVQGAREVEKE